MPDGSGTVDFRFFPGSFSQLQHMEYRSPGMWPRAIGLSEPNISRQPSGLFYKGHISSEIYWTFDP